MRFEGELSTYQVGRYSYPIFTSGDLSSTRCVVFVPGLDAGIGTIPYLAQLSDALKVRNWKLVQFHLSSSFSGYGLSSLHNDVREMDHLVQHLATQGITDLIWMGNSTGCQDIAHYLSSSPSSSTLQARTIHPIVKGGILQAPVSDRESFQYAKSPDSLAENRGVIDEALSKAEQERKAGRGEEIAGREVSEFLGVRITHDRLFSLYGIGGQDDYFSSDLPSNPSSNTRSHAHPLSTSFGRFPVPTLALWSENDQYANSGPDSDTPKERMARWAASCPPGAPLSWEVIQGADHECSGDAGGRVVKAVMAWMERITTA